MRDSWDRDRSRPFHRGPDAAPVAGHAPRRFGLSAEVQPFGRLNKLKTSTRDVAEIAEGLGQMSDLPKGTVTVWEILAYIDRDRYMAMSQAVEYLGLSERNVRQRLPEIPHYRVGRKLLFRKSELDSCIGNYRENQRTVDLRRLADEATAKVLSK